MYLQEILIKPSEEQDWENDLQIVKKTYGETMVSMTLMFLH